MSAPLTQRVIADAYYTDGRRLYQVDRIHALGSVDLRNAETHNTMTVGIDAFRRRFWLAATTKVAITPAPPPTDKG